MKKIVVLLWSREKYMGTTMYQCEIYFEENEHGYRNILSQSTIDHFRKMGIEIVEQFDFKTT